MRRHADGTQLIVGLLVGLTLLAEAAGAAWAVSEMTTGTAGRYAAPSPDPYVCASSCDCGKSYGWEGCRR